MNTADQVVPPEQAAPLRAAIMSYMSASHLAMVDQKAAAIEFKHALALAAALPEPSRTLMDYVNTRNVAALGPILLPHVDAFTGDPALSPARSTTVTAPVFLLHGDEDTVIPPAESVILGETLRQKGANVRVLLSHIITHAELDRAGDSYEAWKLIAFWADLLNR